MRVLFFGSDKVSLVALKRLANEKSLISKLHVVCPTAQFVGRNKREQRLGEVREFALENNLTIFDAPNRSSTRPDITRWKPTPEVIRSQYDLGIVVSFGYFLPEEIITSCRLGALNLHPSLLPKYRGAAPIQKALMNGDLETGVSIIKVHPKTFDAGDIVKQEKINVSENDTFTTLADSLIGLGAEKLLEAIHDIKSGTQSIIEQDPSMVTYARKIQDTDRKIDWNSMTSSNVWNYWRALSENGGIFATCQEKRIKLISLVNPSTSVSPLTSACPGKLHVDNNQLYIECANKTFIECKTLQIEGKNSVDSLSFINGYCKKGIDMFQ